MANETSLAKAVYEDLCASLTRKNWKFQRHDDDLVITFGISGEDIPMDFVLIVDEKRQLFRMLSKLPFAVPEDKRMDLAVATCVATYGLPDGSFDFDITNGAIYFRLTSSFRESKIGEDLFTYLIACADALVDRYNDRFLALCKGTMTITDFINAE